MANFYTPDTAVYLANTPLNVNKKDTFAPNNWTAAAQLQYFQSCIPSPTSRYTFTDFTYQRKDGVIRVPINVEVLYAAGINYCFYRKTHYNGKWFYCIITKMEFLNENTTALYIKTDVFQTWYFEMQLKTSFVEREHTVNDNMFQYTLPEPLPNGEMVVYNKQDIVNGELNARSESEFADNYYCLIMCADVVTNIGDYLIGLDAFSGGSVNGCYMYATTLDSFASAIKIIVESGKKDSVVCCVAIPKIFATFTQLQGGSDPPTPPTPPITNTYLGSPYASHFTINQIYNPPDHYGIDMSGASDKNLYATTNGTVIFAGWNSGGYGNLVVIHSSVNSLYYIYGHMSSISVTSGQPISIGDNIGVEGSTGYSTGSHVHYEITSTYGTSDWNAGSQNPADTSFGAQFQNATGYY